MIFSSNDFVRDARMLLIGGVLGALIARLRIRRSSGELAQEKAQEHEQDVAEKPGESSSSEGQGADEAPCPRRIRRTFCNTDSPFDQVNALLARSGSSRRQSGSSDNSPSSRRHSGSVVSAPARLDAKEDDDDDDEESDEDFAEGRLSRRCSLPLPGDQSRRRTLPSKSKSASGFGPLPSSIGVRRASAGARIEIPVENDPVAKVHDLCFALRNSQEAGGDGITLKPMHLDLIEKALRLSKERRTQDPFEQFRQRLVDVHSNEDDRHLRYFMATCASPAGTHQEVDLLDVEEEEEELVQPASGQNSAGLRALEKLKRRLNVTLPLRRGMMEHRKKVKAMQRDMEVDRIRDAQSEIFQVCSLSSSICDEVSESVSRMHLWDTFDIFKLHSLIPRTMPLILHSALRGAGLVDLLGGLLAETHQVFSLWSDMYNENNPFHTSLHAADVTQAVYHALTSVGLMDRIPSLRALAMLLSAAVHDIGHPGVNNAFLVAAGDEIALRYNDRSVLENMHVATAFLLVHESRIDFWGHLGREGAQFVRKDMIENILATDMAEHADCVANVERISETSPDWSDKDTQALVCKATVHAADISNPTRPWDTYWSFTERVMEEFFNQSELEKQHGLKFPGGLSFLTRRTPMNIQQFQLGFVKAVILPFNLNLDRIKDLDHSDRITQLNRNIDRLQLDSAARQEELQMLQREKSRSSIPEESAEVAAQVAAAADKTSADK